MNRPPMNSVRVCSKCGDGGALDVVGAWRRPIRYVCVGRTFSGSFLEDYLERTCTRCGYEWREACVDATQ